MVAEGHVAAVEVVVVEEAGEMAAEGVEVMVEVGVPRHMRQSHKRWR